MQINNATTSLTLQKQLFSSEASGKNLPLTAPTSAPNDSFQQYDLHNISPIDIDQLADKLRKSGDYDVRDILMLETHGEKFQSHLSINTGREFDASAKKDLLGLTEEKIEMSRQRNEPADLAEGLLKLLQQIDAARSIPREGLFA
jgi:hypothetical protein